TIKLQDDGGGLTQGGPGVSFRALEEDKMSIAALEERLSSSDAEWARWLQQCELEAELIAIIRLEVNLLFFPRTFEDGPLVSG
ncbi:hypothetical protein M9458_037265, partial [Cirrhinus mrigala]